MKKDLKKQTLTLIAFIPFLFQIQCIFFHESELDPSSEFSNLLLLNRILASFVATPTFSPQAAYYNSPQNISINSTTSGAIIRFTTDGTDPNSRSLVYSKEIPIWSLTGKSIRAYAQKSGLVDSGILAGVFSYPPLKTGQTTVFQAGDNGDIQTGVDLNILAPSSNTNYPNDLITVDNSSGLIWKTCTLGLSGSTCNLGTASSLVYSDAISENLSCNLLNKANNGEGFAGIKNWRVPTWQEFSTILSNTRTTGPFINDIAFPGTLNTAYWTSTPDVFDPTRAYAIAFNNLSIGASPRTTSIQIRCVSSLLPKGSNSNFTDNLDGTILDNSTGLFWQKCNIGQTGSSCSGSATQLNWSTAITECRNLTLANRDWRLPNINELITLLDDTKSNEPLINTNFFPSTLLTAYWSSTTPNSNNATARIVQFNTGNNSIGANNKTVNIYYARCVSSP